jgi:hypothetical protein
VHEIQELQFELPAPHLERRSPPSRLRLGIALVVGTLAAFFAVLALSALFAHPAGASVLPGSPPDDPAGLLSSVTQPIVTPDAAVAAIDTPLLTTSAPLASSVATALAPELSPVLTTLAPVASPVVAPLTPIVQPVLVAVAPIVGPVVTTLSPVLTPTLSAATLSLSTSGQSRSNGSSRPVDTLSGLGTQVAGASIVSSVPAPLPTPATPIPTRPVPTTPSSTDGSASPGGSSSPAAHPPLGLLLPDPMMTGLTLGRSKSPGLLFDLRHSPPG